MTSGENPPTPRKNSQLVGHEAAERTLADCWRSGRLAHAWLIAGPRGVGKATLAFRFARFILSGGGGGLFAAAEKGLGVEESDPVFRRVASGAHPDLFTLEPGYDEMRKLRRTEIAVDDVRAAGDFLHLTPAEGGWRVVVVDSADQMNRNAANALLKLLEEPPARSLLLLVSHVPARLIATVRSRCRKLILEPLAENTVVALQRRYRPELADDDARLLARLSDGSIGRALELEGEGGLELYRRVADLILALPRPDAGALHNFADRLQRSEGPFRTASQFLTWWLARMIRAGSTGAIPADLVPGEGACMRRLLAARDLDQWLRLWEKTVQLFARTEGARLDRRQVWVTAFLDLECDARP